MPSSTRTHPQFRPNGLRTGYHISKHLDSELAREMLLTHIWSRSQNLSDVLMLGLPVRSICLETKLWVYGIPWVTLRSRTVWEEIWTKTTCPPASVNRSVHRSKRSPPSQAFSSGSCSKGSPSRNFRTSGHSGKSVSKGPVKACRPLRSSRYWKLIRYY